MTFHIIKYPKVDYLYKEYETRRLPSMEALNSALHACKYGGWLSHSRNEIEDVKQIP
jgi:hypothetical protein